MFEQVIIFFFFVLSLWTVLNDRLAFSKFTNEVQFLKGIDAALYGLGFMGASFAIDLFLFGKQGSFLSPFMACLALIIQVKFEPDEYALWSQKKKRFAFLLVLACLTIFLTILSAGRLPSYLLFTACIYLRHRQNFRVRVAIIFKNLEVLKLKLLSMQAAANLPSHEKPTNFTDNLPRVG